MNAESWGSRSVENAEFVSQERTKQWKAEKCTRKFFRPKRLIASVLGFRKMQFSKNSCENVRTVWKLRVYEKLKVTQARETRGLSEIFFGAREVYIAENLPKWLWSQEWIPMVRRSICTLKGSKKLPGAEWSSTYAWRSLKSHPARGKSNR